VEKMLAHMDALIDEEQALGLSPAMWRSRDARGPDDRIKPAAYELKSMTRATNLRGSTPNGRKTHIARKGLCRGFVDFPGIGRVGRKKKKTPLPTHSLFRLRDFGFLCPNGALGN